MTIFWIVVALLAITLVVVGILWVMPDDVFSFQEFFGNGDASRSADAPADAQDGSDISNDEKKTPDPGNANPSGDQKVPGQATQKETSTGSTTHAAPASRANTNFANGDLPSAEVLDTVPRVPRRADDACQPKLDRGHQRRERLTQAEVDKNNAKRWNSHWDQVKRNNGRPADRKAASKAATKTGSRSRTCRPRIQNNSIQSPRHHSGAGVPSKLKCPKGHPLEPRHTGEEGTRQRFMKGNLDPILEKVPALEPIRIDSALFKSARVVAILREEQWPFFLRWAKSDFPDALGLKCDICKTQFNEAGVKMMGCDRAAGDDFDVCLPCIQKGKYP